MLQYFGNFPIARSNYVNEYLSKMDVTRISPYYELVSKMIKQLRLQITEVDNVNTLANLFQALEQVLADVSHKLVLYIDDDAYDAQTDVISYLFQGVVTVRLFNEYKPGDSVSVLLYNQQTPEIKDFLAQHPDLISLRWVHQLPTTENYSRLLLLINKYRYNIFKNL